MKSQVPVRSNLIPFIRTVEHFFEKGMQAYARTDFVGARKYFQCAYEMEPNEPLVAMQLAMVLTDLEEYEASNVILLRVLEELDPGLEDCHYFLANNYALLEQYDKALKHLHYYIHEAVSIEFFEEAEELHEVLLSELADTDALLPKETDLIRRQDRIRILMNTGEIPDAIVLLEDTIAHYPEFWPAYNNLAMSFFYMGDFEQSISILRKVLVRNPGNLHALCNLFVILKELGSDDEAMPILDTLKKINPMNLDHCLKLAVTFSWTGEYQFAYKWFKYCTPKVMVTDFKFYFWFAKAAYHIGKTDEAEMIYEKLKQQYPDKAGSTPPWELEMPVYDDED